MATYKLQGSDGRVYHIDGPDGATEEQLSAFLTQRHQQAQQANQTTYDPTDGMSWGEKFAAGIGAGVHRAGQGIGQLVGLSNQNDIDETARLNAPLSNTGAGKLGEIAGNMAALAPTLAIPGANTVTGAAAIGALSNALTTPGNLWERGGAAATGAAGGAIGQTLPRVVSSLRAAAEPLTEAGRQNIVGKVLNKAAGDNPSSAATRMSSAQPLVPGSYPTAAEVAENGGIAALQRSAAAADPEAYAFRAAQQSGARAAAVGDIAGDVGQKEFFNQARNHAANELYQKAFSAPLPQNMTPQLQAEAQTLLKLPAVQEGANAARINAQNQGIDISNMDGSLLGLHHIKLAMDDKISKLMGGTAAEVNKANGIRAARDRLVGFMENISPDYQQARLTYAGMSRPINQMDVGQRLYDTLKPALSDSGAIGQESAAAFARALRNGNQTAQLATGRNLKLNDILDGEQISTLNNVAADLARKANANNLGRGVGSNTYQNFAMDNLADSMGIPSAVKAIAGAIPGLSPTATLIAKGAQSAGSLAYKKADEQIRQDLAQALLNPQAASRLMNQVSGNQNLANALSMFPQSMQTPKNAEMMARILRGVQAIPGNAGVVLNNARQPGVTE